jgi:hypothetical protein
MINTERGKHNFNFSLLKDKNKKKRKKNIKNGLNRINPTDL